MPTVNELRDKLRHMLAEKGVKQKLSKSGKTYEKYLEYVIFKERSATKIQKAINHIRSADEIKNRYREALHPRVQEIKTRIIQKELRGKFVGGSVIEAHLEPPIECIATNLEAFKSTFAALNRDHAHESMEHSLKVKLSFSGSSNGIAGYGSQSFEYDNSNVMEKGVLAFKKEWLKHHDTSTYTIFLSRIDYLSLPKTNAGGCHKENSKYKLIKNIQIENGKYPKTLFQIYTLKSSNNNCLFACLNNHYNVKGSSFRADAIRAKLEIEKDIMISINDIEHIAKEYAEFKPVIMVYGADMKILKVIGTPNEEGTSNICHIMLMDDHYYYCKYKEYKKCPECGKEYTSVHDKCNPNMVNYYKKRIQKQNILDVDGGKKKSKKTLQDSDIVYFDFETFQNEEMNKHTVYCVAWKHDGVYYCEYGKESLAKFIEFIVSHKNLTYVAYNGSCFDNYILLNEFLKMGLPLSKPLFNAGKLMKLVFGDNNSFFDPCLFLACSLKDACKSFKIENSKMDFDHNLIKGWHSVDQYKDEVEYYIKYDILALEELTTKFRKLLMDIDFDIYDYVTISHMAYEIWKTKIDPTMIIEIPNDRKKYDFIRNAIYGGRCYPMQQKFTSSIYDDVVEGKKNYDDVLKSGDYAFAADVTSLYPAAMRGVDFHETLYPSGISYWSQNPEQDFKDGMYGIYKVSYTAPKNIIYPILPKHSDAGGLSWDLMDGTGYYSNIDISNALKHGYEIDEYIEALVYPNTCNPYGEYVNYFYEMKLSAEKEDNEVLRSIAKLFLNSLYGKMLQGAKDESFEICKNMEDIGVFLMDNEMCNFDVVGDYDCILLKGRKKNFEEQIRKPSQLGVFVLSHSRAIMLHYMCVLDTTLTKHTFYYTDTDSIYIGGKEHDILVEKGLCLPKDDAKLGYMCSDIKKEGIILNARFLAPKCKAYEFINNENGLFIGDNAGITSKGIPVYDPKYKNTDYKEDHRLLRFEDYDKNEPKVCEFNGLKKNGNKLNNTDIEKNVEMFSITNVNQNRTFLLNQWGGFDLKYNKFYPKQYNSIKIFKN